MTFGMRMFIRWSQFPGLSAAIAFAARATAAYMIAGFVADAIGRRAFLSLTNVGSLITTFVTYKLTTSVEAMMIVAPINGFFTLGCAYVWMAIYPCELFGSS